MNPKEKRQELNERAEKLGLSFARNANLENMETEIREAEDAAILAAVETEEDLEIENDEEVGITDISNVDAIRKELEAEFEAKLEVRAAEIRATYEHNETTGASPDLTAGLMKKRAIEKATKLIRCIITNRNPLKSSWEGEIIAVSNDMIGMQRKYVPYNLEEGYHLPQIIIDTLKDKECTIFVNSKTKNGEKVKVGKLIKEYAIEILPPLSESELQELAADQRARGAIDQD